MYSLRTLLMLPLCAFPMWMAAKTEVLSGAAISFLVTLHFASSFLLSVHLIGEYPSDSNHQDPSALRLRREHRAANIGTMVSVFVAMLMLVGLYCSGACQEMRAIPVMQQLWFFCGFAAAVVIASILGTVIGRLSLQARRLLKTDPAAETM